MTLSVTLDASPEQLKFLWQDLKQKQPKLRIRNAAQQLGVSELDLLLTGLGESVTLLKEDFAQILIDLELVGRVIALTRNEQVVHERHGTYVDFTVNKAGTMGLCLGEIDLRAFLGYWHTALAVEEPIVNTDKQRRSIQFFDIEGTAAHKVYLTDNTNEAAWNDIIAKYLREDQNHSFIAQAKPKKAYPNSGKVTAEQIRDPWSKLKDVHHFQAMLKKLAIDRLEALQLVGKDYATQLTRDAAENTLQLAAMQKLDIMVFVGNGNIVQIHTGPVSKLVRTGPWYNVLDPDFNLHVNTEEITDCWLVKRPSSDGTITSVECFNGKREIVLTFFGARKPGQEELSGWRSLTDKLERLS